MVIGGPSTILRTFDILNNLSLAGYAAMSSYCKLSVVLSYLASLARRSASQILTAPYSSRTQVFEFNRQVPAGCLDKQRITVVIEFTLLVFSDLSAFDPTPAEINAGSQKCVLLSPTQTKKLQAASRESRPTADVKEHEIMCSLLTHHPFQPSLGTKHDLAFGFQFPDLEAARSDVGSTKVPDHFSAAISSPPTLSNLSNPDSPLQTNPESYQSTASAVQKYSALQMPEQKIPKDHKHDNTTRRSESDSETGPSRVQLSWMTYAPISHVLAQPRTRHTARLSEVGSTLANLGVYAARIGVDMNPICQTLSPRCINSFQMNPQSPLAPEQGLPGQVLREQMFTPEARPVAPAPPGAWPVDRSAAFQLPPISIDVAETTKVSEHSDGGTKVNEMGHHCRSGSGVGASSLKATLVTCSVVNEYLPTHVPKLHAQLEHVDRISQGGGDANKLAKPRSVGSLMGGRSRLLGESTGAKGGRKPHPHIHVRGHPLAHVQAPDASRRQARGTTGRPSSTISGHGHVQPRSKPIDKLILIALVNSIKLQMYICECGKASSKEHEKLLKTLDEVDALSHNPQLTLQLIADVKLGHTLRKLRADKGFGPEVRGKALDILHLWRKTLIE
ncbi:hypothetical protein P691DRAFT_784968 [Macrolepiota fuliginosa MF-IS2]|uniref:TFIIS N-terminal domain-containing protein n=1 Tax=Macrolepiota fuliginosa MF-IS2 TaxID=1400762 RepID=A0A9P6C8I4_9AGAR|nr:hypothetical protein P691DRAFT_784968 [Macrolepiota fuliginosa MF-IS2]